MSNKLYVGGLPYSVTEGQLQEVFAAHGTVESVKVIADKFTGQSRGFGFVEMSSGGEAQKAMQALNGTQLEGRTLVVNEAKPMGSRDSGGRGSRGGGGGGNRRERSRSLKTRQGQPDRLPLLSVPESGPGLRLVSFFGRGS